MRMVWAIEEAAESVEHHTAWLTYTSTDLHSTTRPPPITSATHGPPEVTYRDCLLMGPGKRQGRRCYAASVAQIIARCSDRRTVPKTTVRTPAGLLEHVRVESSTWSSCVCIVRTSWPSSIHSYGFARVLLSRAAAHAAAKEDEP